MKKNIKKLLNEAIFEKRPLSRGDKLDIFEDLPEGRDCPIKAIKNPVKVVFDDDDFFGDTYIVEKEQLKPVKRARALARSILHLVEDNPRYQTSAYEIILGIAKVVGVKILLAHEEE